MLRTALLFLATAIVVPVPITVAPTTAWIYGPAGGVTSIPSGETILTDTLVIENQFGPEIVGIGLFRSTLVWQGPATKPVISFRSCNSPIVRNLTIRFDTPARSAICLSTSASPTVTNTSALIENVWIEGGGKVTDCIEINNKADGGIDNNGEYHRIVNCRFNQFIRNGVGIYCSQSHRCVIDTCQFADGGTAVYARFGSQTMQNCGGGNLDLVFYGSDQYAGVGRIVNNNFENCKRFCDLRLPNGQWDVSYNRCDGMKPIDGPATDYNSAAVFAHASGSIKFDSNSFGVVAPNKPIRILFQGSSGLTFTNNRFGQLQPVVTIQQQSASLAPAWQGNRWTDKNGLTTEIGRPK